MVTTLPKLRKEVIDIVFPGMKESELLNLVETDFPSFWKQWRAKPGTQASLELITELQGLYPEKFTTEAVREINRLITPPAVTPPIVGPITGEPPLQPTPLAREFPVEGDIFSVLRDIYPEMFLPEASYGFTLEEIPQMVLGVITGWAQDDPEDFLKDLFERDGTGRAEQLLELLGAPPEEIGEISAAFVDVEAQEARLAELVAGVYPDLTPEEFYDYLETDFESFLDDMQTGGMTKEKLDLLHRGMGIPFQSETELDIQDFFQQIKIVVPIDNVRQLVTITPDGRAFNAKGQWVGTYNQAAGEFTKAKTDEGFIKEGILDPLKFALKTTWHRAKQFFASVVPELIYPPMPDWYPEPIRDFMNETNRQQRDQWRKVYALNQTEYEKWVVKHPELIPKPEWEEGWSEHPELILNPAYMSYEFASTAPVTVSVMTAVMGTQLLTGNPLLAMWAGMNLMVPVETADVYEALLDAGAPEGQAPAMALFVGTAAGLIETLSDLFVLKVIAPGAAALFRKEALKEISKVTVAYTLKKGVTVFTQVEAIEIAEELLTQAITNAALKVYDENVEIWDDLIRTAAKTFAAVLPLAVFGGASTTIAISRQQSVQFTDTEKIEKGWEKDPASGNWFRPMTPEEIVSKLEEGKVLEPAIPEEVPAVPEAVRTLPLEEVSKLETRAPLDLIRKDEAVEIARLTEEIKEKGITEPITIRVREDGSQIVWDGLHRLIVAQDLGIKNIPIQFIGEVQKIRPAVEVAKPPVKPEVFMTEEMWEDMPVASRAKAAREVGLESKVGSKAWADLTIAEKEAFGIEIPKPPVEKLPAVTEEIIGLPPPTEPITTGIASNTQGLNEITAKEEIRPSRKVFTKMGIWRDFYKPMSRAEVLINEEKEIFSKERRVTNKLIGKDAERRAFVWDEVNEKGSVVGLTFDEKRAVARIRGWADKWADRKNLPESKRIKDYIPHLFEEEMIREIREENGIDPVLARILDEEFAGKITDPFLKQRLGKKIGLLKDPIAAMEAYDNVSLKVLYYAPMLNKINAYMSDLNIPEGSRLYLRNYARRMTGELANVDIALNKMIGEFAEAIRKAPVFGEWLYGKLTTGNPAGMAAYNLTSALYGLWLGLKFTSAIRNLSQHTLIIADVGPVYFAESFRLGLTAEGRAFWKDSVNRRSRKRAFLPGYDSSFIAGWVQKTIDISLKMFRGADWVNTHTAFLAGVAEAKAILTKANDALPADRKVSLERLREYIIDRGDEVFADTQYLYTKMNSMAFAQNAPGRVLSMLTTWTENWLELMAKWVKRTPSQVYLEFERETGAKVARANWATSYKAILLYMLIVGLGYALKEKTRLKAWEYTGITSVRYLADIIGGDFPALQAPGAVADTVVGFLTQDERRLNEGLYKLKSTFTPSIMKQLDSIASGDKDWLTLFFYLEGRNIEILRLKEKWEKGWEDYPIFEDAEARRAFILKNRDYAGLTDTAMRKKWREESPLIEAKMFVVGQFTTLSSDKARAEVLRLIEKHKLDTELIDGYEKVFGIDTKAELQKFQNRIGNLEKLEIDKEAEYFTMGDYVSEINALVKSVGRHKVQTEGSPLTQAILEAQDTFEAYEIIKEGDARTLWRQQYPEGEAWLYLLGRVSSFKNPKSAEILLGLMKKYDIPPQAIRGFIDDPTRYDDLFTQKFELEQKWFDQTTEYENFGNTEAPNYIEDAELRKEARAKFKEDNPDWVADMRRIEAIDNDASDDIIEKWVDRGKTIDEFGAGSSQARVWLLDNPEVHKWALEKELLTETTEGWNEPILRINVKWDREDEWYNEGIPDKHKGIENYDAREATIAKEREQYLLNKPEYNKARYRRDAYGLRDKNFNPLLDELVEPYVDYYTLPKKPDDWLEGVAYYEDEWFLQNNPEFHRALVEFGKFKELKDFSKVPTRDIFKKWWIYNTLTTGYERDTYRLENPDLDEWGVSIGIWTKTMSEQRRRITISPTERFLEDVAEKEAEFDRRMKEIEELLAGAR